MVCATRRSHGPQAAGPGEPVHRVAAFETARRGQQQRREKGRARDADLLVGFGRAALGGGDVRAALQQLRRHARRESPAARCAAARGPAPGSPECVPSESRWHARKVARETPTPMSCARVVSSWVRACATSAREAQAAVEAVLRQVEGSLVGHQRLVQKLLLANPGCGVRNSRWPVRHAG